MKKLYKHALKQEPTLKFVTDALENTNLLSMELLKFINSNRGDFFTLLPDNADLSMLHRFNCSILKQNPIYINEDNGKKWGYQKIPTIDDEVCSVLIDKLEKNNKLTCVFDNFNATYTECYGGDLYNNYGMHYNKEVYYFVDSSSVSKEVLLTCFRLSNTFWHSVCVLSEVSKQDVGDKKLTINKAREICSKMQLAMFAAYDGEGYVFWEKNSS